MLPHFPIPPSGSSFVGALHAFSGHSLLGAMLVGLLAIDAEAPSESPE